MRISDWSSDVCSSDLYHIKITDAITLPTPNDVFGPCFEEGDAAACALIRRNPLNGSLNGGGDTPGQIALLTNQGTIRSEEHTSELQSLMRLSYAVFCLKKKKPINQHLAILQQYNTHN